MDKEVSIENIVQPRVWWEQNRHLTDLPDLLEFVTRFAALDVRPYCTKRHEATIFVNRLLDNEENLGITRDDWVFLNGTFYFTNDDMALMAKLVII